MLAHHAIDKRKGPGTSFNVEVKCTVLRLCFASFFRKQPERLLQIVKQDSITELEMVFRFFELYEVILPKNAPYVLTPVFVF